MCLKAENEVPEQGRVSGGVKGITLDGKDEVIFTAFVGEDAVCMLGSTFGTFKKVKLSAITPLGRARKGVKIFELGDEKFGELVLAATLIGEDKTKIMINDRFGTQYFAIDGEVETESRTSKGKFIRKIGNCQPLTIFFAEGGKRQ